MKRRRIHIAALCIFVATPALAQDVLQPHRRPVVLDQVCAEALAHFCPDLSGSHLLRDQLICLRPYHFSLSSSCRKAMAAAQHR